MLAVWELYLNCMGRPRWLKPTWFWADFRHGAVISKNNSGHVCFWMKWRPSTWNVIYFYPQSIFSSGGGGSSSGGAGSLQSSLTLLQYLTVRTKTAQPENTLVVVVEEHRKHSAATHIWHGLNIRHGGNTTRLLSNTDTSRPEVVRVFLLFASSHWTSNIKEIQIHQEASDWLRSIPLLM